MKFCNSFSWKTIVTIFILSASIGCKQKITNDFGKQLGYISDLGLVTTAHPVSSRIGAEILADGGNAYDAAVAVHFAMAVCYPRAGNIGGGGFAIVRKSNGEKNALDFREMAPRAAHKDMYLDEEGNVIEGLSLTGPLACGVPGSVMGMWELHQKYGHLPWAHCVQPAIDIAVQGFPLTSAQADLFNNRKEAFLPYNSADIPFLRKEKWMANDVFIQEDLGETLKRIQSDGAEGFYKGETAQIILDNMTAKGGIITRDDLENYKAIWRKPLEASFDEFHVITMPPPSSGGVALIQMLKGGQDFPWKEWGFQSEQAIHINVELQKRAFADRASYLGDMDYVHVPIERLISDAYIQERIKGISLEVLTPSQDIKEGDVDEIESIETTHYSITDAEGNAVAVTTTVNSFFGNKVMMEGAGFFMNNEMDDFSIKTGYANQFGLVGNDQNAIEPGKRMLSSMTPTIVERNGQLDFLLGSPGGSTIITTVYQVIQNITEYQMTMQEAVNAPRLHQQWLPEPILMERNRLNPEVKSALSNRGYTFDEHNFIGRVNAIRRLENGDYEAGVDTMRGDCTAYSEHLITTKDKN